MFTRIDTGSELVRRYDNALPADSCRAFSRYILRATAKNSEIVDGNRVPWQDGDNLPWRNLPDGALKKSILDYSKSLAECIRRDFGVLVYPTFQDLVLWRTGRHMKFHADDGTGYEGAKKFFHMRKFSSVTYLNEDYTGGETVVRNPNGHEFTSRPRTGAAVVFTSDERCLHMVREVTRGARVTLAVWFTDDPRYREGD